MIKIARLKKGLSQKELATKLGITQSYLSKLENRQAVYSKNINLDFLISLASELDLCPWELFRDLTGYCKKCNINCQESNIE